jgi:hypothetical protein
MVELEAPKHLNSPAGGRDCTVLYSISCQARNLDRPEGARASFSSTRIQDDGCFAVPKRIVTVRIWKLLSLGPTIFTKTYSNGLGMERVAQRGRILGVHESKRKPARRDTDRREPCHAICSTWRGGL